jgi:hypothetical protein
VSLHEPATAKLSFRTLAAVTESPKFVADAVTEAEHVAAQLPTMPVPLPSEASPAPTRDTDSVWPEHASGIPPTSTRVSCPALSTFRVELSDVTPQELTAALPAERFAEPKASVEADALPANATATARTSVTDLATGCIHGALPPPEQAGNISDMEKI